MKTKCRLKPKDNLQALDRSLLEQTLPLLDPKYLIFRYISGFES